VDDRLNAQLKAVGQRFDVQEAAFVSEMEKRFDRTEKRFGDKLDKLMTTLDRFLKCLTDSEDEFALLKREVSRIKTAIREKLGVTVE